MLLALRMRPSSAILRGDPMPEPMFPAMAAPPDAFEPERLLRRLFLLLLSLVDGRRSPDLRSSSSFWSNESWRLMECVCGRLNGVALTSCVLLTIAPTVLFGWAE